MDRVRTTDENGQPRRATRQGILGDERVLCVNATNGSIVWKHTYDCPYTISYAAGPRTTPLVHENRVYTLGAMGNLLCLEAADGTVRWSKNLVTEYSQDPPIWGYAAHPLIDGDLVYCLVGGPGSAVVAFNRTTGAETWRALNTAEIGYSPPMIYSIDRKRQLIVWLLEAIYGLEPSTGKTLWKHDYPEGVATQRPVLNVITVKQINDKLFLSSWHHGPMMLKISENKASVVWKGKSNNPLRPDGAHCLMASPIFQNGLGYAVGSRGELSCFDAETGKQHWQTYAATGGRSIDCGTAFLTPYEHGCVVFNDQGDLILAKLSKTGYQEIDRAHILDPVGVARGRNVVWSHPAFAHRSVFARNDKEMIRASLAKEG